MMPSAWAGSSPGQAFLIEALTPEPSGDRSAKLEATADLLALVRGGDTRARDRLVARYLPVLRAWAHGRLPAGSRQIADTDDLVQWTLIRTLNQIEGFRSEREGAFLAYLRQAVLNALRDEIRRSTRERRDGEPDETIPDPGPSPLESLIGRERLERYEAALASLPEEMREAVILRLEMGYQHAEIAEALGKPSANAARMVVSRALLRLAQSMEDHDGTNR